MKVADIIAVIETLAPPELQESWDNTGLLTGNARWDCSGVLCALDATVEVVQEAVARNCNLIVTHHPIIFKGLKHLTGKSYAEAAVIEALKNDIAIYAAHTALDNVLAGVNGMIAEKLGLIHCKVLAPQENVLRRLVTFVPTNQAEGVRQALFSAGAGHIGNYSECSFNSQGTGTYKAGAGANPYVGMVGTQHQEEETRLEVVFPAYLERPVMAALLQAHPYEEVAYDIFAMQNRHPGIGAGLIGHLPHPVAEQDFLKTVQNSFKTPCVRHTPLLNRPLEKVAVCGGSGAFLIKQAIRQGAGAYITADIKYHEFFDAEGQLVLMDVGHYESEQFTIDLLHKHIEKKFPTFAVLKTGVNTNPVQYFRGA